MGPGPRCRRGDKKGECTGHSRRFRWWRIGGVLRFADKKELTSQGGQGSAILLRGKYSCHPSEPTSGQTLAATAVPAYTLRNASILIQRGGAITTRMLRRMRIFFSAQPWGYCSDISEDSVYSDVGGTMSKFTLAQDEHESRNGLFMMTYWDTSQILL